MITGKDIAKRDHIASYRQWLQIAATRWGHRFINEIDNDASPVTARVERNRLIADCECGGAEYVDPDDPVFYCVSCGNVSTGGKLRRVVVPKAVQQMLK